MRRKPQQLRSREMVDKLIDATGKVIVARGLDYATTNHIAEEAGVNIASLYHYFGNKEEMIEALQDRMTQDLLQTLVGHAAGYDLKALSMRDIAETSILFTLEHLRANPVFMELSRHWSRLSLQRSMAVIEQHLLQICAAYFRQHFRTYPIEDLHIRLYVLLNGAMATVARHLCEGSPVIKDRELVSVLADMIVGVLEKGMIEES